MAAVTFGQAISRARAAGSSPGASLRAAWADVRAGRASRPPRRRHLPRVNPGRRPYRGLPPLRRGERVGMIGMDGAGVVVRVYGQEITVKWDGGGQTVALAGHLRRLPPGNPGSRIDARCTCGHTRATHDPRCYHPGCPCPAFTPRTQMATNPGRFRIVIGWFTEEAPGRPHAAVYRSGITAAAVPQWEQKAAEYARSLISPRVFVYPMRERDPLGATKRAMMQANPSRRPRRARGIDRHRPPGDDMTFYKGHAILKMPVYYAKDEAYQIQKGGVHLSWASSVDDAKRKIDAVVGTNPPREHRPRVTLAKRGAVMVLGRRSPYTPRRVQHNPPVAGAVRIYDGLLAIEARKGRRSAYPGKAFRHTFRTRPVVWGLPDGSLLVRPK